MKMSEWAKREVGIACKKENPNMDGEEFDYVCASYQSALKAYNSLCEDGHSGMSFALTKNILIRLMDGKPLTPITDEDFFIDGNECYPFEDAKSLAKRGLKSKLQCPRMTSLFREETLDGKVSYYDIYRVSFIDKDGHSWTNGIARDIIDRMFPITMPYSPDVKEYKVFGEDFLLDEKNGDYDHQAFIYAITPYGVRVELDEYYKEVNGKMVKIPKAEYISDRLKAVFNKYGTENSKD